MKRSGIGNNSVLSKFGTVSSYSSARWTTWIRGSPRTNSCSILQDIFMLIQSLYYLFRFTYNRAISCIFWRICQASCGGSTWWVTSKLRCPSRIGLEDWYKLISKCIRDVYRDVYEEHHLLPVTLSECPGSSSWADLYTQYKSPSLFLYSASVYFIALSLEYHPTWIYRQNLPDTLPVFVRFSSPPACCSNPVRDHGGNKGYPVWWCE